MAELGQKRSLEPVRDPKTGVATSFQVINAAKKQRTELVAVTENEGGDDRPGGELIEAPGIKRTSALMAPNMQLKGHQGHVYSAKFNGEGDLLATSSADHSVALWEVYGECKNVAMIKGHSGDVLDVCWSRDGDLLYSASADKNGCVFDVDRGVRLKRMRGHTSHVNSIVAARRGDPLVLTGSDDCTALLWDTRWKYSTASLKHKFPITSVAFSDDSSRAFCGGLDNLIHCWDLRADKILFSLEGHRDTVTGIKLSADGSHLLSNGMDHVLHKWDIRPFCSGNRLMGSFMGHQHDFQKNLLKCSWSPDGQRVSCGSSDRFVYVWDAVTHNILYKLPGHNACVSEVDFHPKEPIIASAGADKTIFLGEIDAA